MAAKRGEYGVKNIKVFRPGAADCIWEYTASEDEFVYIGYARDFVTIDFYQTPAEMSLLGGMGDKRKIFYGCSVIADMEMTK
jgi:hypothetical protein